MTNLITINYDANQCCAIFCYAIYDGKFSVVNPYSISHPNLIFGTEQAPKPISVSDIVDLLIPS